jgi:hypothetical protein
MKNKLIGLSVIGLLALSVFLLDREEDVVPEPTATEECAIRENELKGSLDTDDPSVARILLNEFSEEGRIFRQKIELKDEPWLSILKAVVIILPTNSKNTIIYLLINL